MKRFILLSFLSITTVSFAQTSHQGQDAEAIKGMCGCFEVEFNFAETFVYADDSSYTSSPVKQASALEWVELIEDTENKLSLQHLLIVGPRHAPTIVKHWRQDWLFQNTDFYDYHADNEWVHLERTPEEVVGQWTQRVYQTDDRPRYSASASWVHVDGRSYWEAECSAPLPRREYTIRDDYNVTYRRNRHEVTSEGWIHDQDNDKIIRARGEEDLIVAQEKGYNIYRLTDPNRCKAARKYWKENKDMWSHVRTTWEQYYAKHEDLILREEVDEKTLTQHLNEVDPKAKPEEIDALVGKFVK